MAEPNKEEIEYPQGSYKFWYAALDARKAGKPDIPVPSDGIARPGYYKTRAGKLAPYEPCAIDLHEGAAFALIGFRNNARRVPAKQVWPFCAKHQLDYESEFMPAFNAGQWGSDAPIEAVPAADGVVTTQHNVDPEAPEMPKGAKLAEEVADLTATLQAHYSTRRLLTKDDADRCENARKALTGAAKALDTQRKAENKPHDDAIAATNAAYFPAIRGAGPVLAIMERKINEWGEGEAKRLTEQAAAAERAAAEKLGRATDEAPPAPVVPPKVMVGTIGNRRSAAPKAPPATATITNWPQATLYYGDHPRLRALVQELANYDARAKKPVPGATMSWETSEKQEAANA